MRLYIFTNTIRIIILNYVSKNKKNTRVLYNIYMKTSVSIIDKTTTLLYIYMLYVYITPKHFHKVLTP